ncbi:MAG: helix-turn-helix domain-containing protein [Longimicrobiaceae bacterium]
MSEQPIQLLMLHGDERVRAAISEAASPNCACVIASDWSALMRVVRNSPPTAVAVVDPYSRCGTRLAPELYSLLACFPFLPVLAALAITKARSSEIQTLASWGVADVVAIGHDDTVTALLYRSRQARTRSLHALLHGVVSQDLPERARAILFASARCAADRATVDDVAAQLGVSSRTLLRWCAQASLPPPNEILAALRVLIAAVFLDDPDRSIQSVASGLGYGSEPALRRATLKVIGLTPTQLRARGAVATAVGVVRARLATPFVPARAPTPL